MRTAHGEKYELVLKLTIWKWFEEVEKLVESGVSILWGCFKDCVLMACCEVCGMRSRRKGDAL